MRRLSPKDELIVSTIQRFRQVRAKQIERLVFADASEGGRDSWCRRSLLRLFEHGYVNRLERHVGGMTGSEGFIYQRVRPKTRRRTPDLHALLLTEVYVRVKEAERAGRLEVLRFDPVPYSLEWVEVGDFQPDAFMRFRVPSGTYRRFVEVDEDTEDRLQFVAKLAAYARAFREWPSRGFPRVLFVVEDTGRKHELQRWVNQQPEDSRHIFEVALLDETVDRLTLPQPSTTPLLTV
jgi:hypothetical protein